MFNLIHKGFDRLSYCTTINEKAFVCHGGLFKSYQDFNIFDLEKLTHTNKSEIKTEAITEVLHSLVK
jgi:hypothetical protein